MFPIINHSRESRNGMPFHGGIDVNEKMPLYGVKLLKSCRYTDSKLPFYGSTTTENHAVIPIHAF